MHDPSDEPSPQRGRPRSPERDSALLRAARELLAEQGYDRLAMGSVADRAGAGKNTLYRRWPDKRALAVDAVASLEPDVHEFEAADLGLRDALVRIVELWQTDSLMRDQIALGMLPALVRDAELRDAFVAAMGPSREAVVLRAVHAAVARGEIAPPRSPERIGELLGGLALVRFVRTGRAMTLEEGEEIIDEILLPLLRTPRQADDRA